MKHSTKGIPVGVAMAAMALIWLGGAQPLSVGAQGEEGLPPAIVSFESALTSITVDAAEEGKAPTTLSWHAVGVTDAHRLQLQYFQLNKWITVDDDLEAVGSSVVNVQHPMNFGPPMFRLALYDDQEQVIDQWVLSIPYEGAAGAPTIESFTTAERQIFYDTLYGGSYFPHFTPVRWRVVNRIPGSNLVFEQVMPDGRAISVEMPRLQRWVSSQGIGQVQSVLPFPAMSSDEDIKLRLRLVHTVTGEVYDERELVIPVVGAIPPPTPTLPAGRPAATVTPACIFFFGRGEGCPAEPAREVQAAYQPFERGHMVWRADWGEVYVHFNDRSAYHFIESVLDSAPDNPVTEMPPEGFYKPVSGFGRVWGNFVDVRERLGWATAPEQGYTMRVQQVRVEPTVFVLHYLTLPDGRVVGTGFGRWDYVSG